MLINKAKGHGVEVAMSKPEYQVS